MSALQGTDAAFAPGAPPQPSAIPALAWRGRPPAHRRAPAGKDHALDAAGQRRAFVRRRREPHPDDVWPDSAEFIQRELGHLPAEAHQKIVRENAGRFYGLTS